MSNSFIITAPSHTDIWCKPPCHSAFNAPTSHGTRCPLKAFGSARITLTLPPRSQLIQYDQGGLLLRIIAATTDGVRERDGEVEEKVKDRWLKTGIEFYLGEPWLGTVGCDRWADWSVAPLISPTSDSTTSHERPSATIEVKRSRDELGKSLWVYALQLSADGEELKRVPLRELNWFFAEEDEGNGWEVDISAYAARPGMKEGDQGLVAEFEGWSVVSN